MSSSLAEQDTGTSLPTSQSLKDMVGHALARAEAAGATAAEAMASGGTGLSVNVRMGEVESVEHQRDRHVAVTVWFGKRTGSATTSDPGMQAIDQAVESACRIARFTMEDPHTGLADPALLAREIPDLDLYHPRALDVDDAIADALACEDAARSDTRITNSEGAGVSTNAGVMAYGNSNGFLASERGTRHSIGCAVVAGQGSGMQRDYWHSVARCATDLEPAADVGQRAAERAVARLDARQIPTTSCPVLFVPEVARSLLGHFVGAVRGSALYREASFLAGMLDETIFPDFVRIHEQPHLPRALGSSTFDNEGVATRARDLVTAGVLRGYVLDSYSARRLGMETTGNAGGVHNLTLEPGSEDFTELLRRMDSGLVVTEMMGMGVSTVTGDYSRGAAGFRVENGAIVHPVQEITVAGNLRDMFRGIVAVGSDLDTRAGIRTPSILIDRMTVAGS